MHRDHVPSLPPSFHLLGTTDVSPVQGMVKYTDGKEPSTDPKDIQIITVQGHPEFTSAITSRIVDVRETVGVMDIPTARQARERAEWRNDGPGPIMRAVWKVLGVE